MIPDTTGKDIYRHFASASGKVGFLLGKFYEALRELSPENELIGLEGQKIIYKDEKKRQRKHGSLENSRINVIRHR